MRKCAFLLLLCTFWAMPALGASRPNVIVILADDLGAEGLACYGSTIYTTPHLDRMASEGVRFNNAYATPLCTPTRVMLMSGLYPGRTGFQALISKDEGVRVPPTIKTFGQYFREAGYQTAVAGKWQLGKFDEYPRQAIEHGFPEYCLWTWEYNGRKSSRYYKPEICRDGKIIQGGPDDFGPDLYCDFLLDFIDRNKDQPFFVYYPMALVHAPFIHPPKLEELARTKFTKDLDKSTMAFGHMVTYMDFLVGKILARLTEHGLEKNTLVLFTGDNGTGRPITSKLPGMDLQGGKGTMTEAGTRVPMLAWWPETIKPAVRDELFCLVDVLPTVAPVAGIKLDRKLDGMDLSHLLLGKEGQNREQVLINLGKKFFVRDARLRLDEGGVLYDTPATSDRDRYSETQAAGSAFGPEREQLQRVLKDFMAIQSEYEKPGKSKEAKRESAKKESAKQEDGR